MTHKTSPPPPSPPARGYGALCLLQAQNSFNDKVAQFLLIPLAYWLTDHAGASYGGIPHLLGVIIVLPYLLLGPIVGWLSDRFSKTHVLRGAVVMQMLTFAFMLWSVWAEQFWGLLLGFFLLAIQSSVVSPAKRGLVKELVGAQRLGIYSGILEMAIILAICVGQITAGYWFTLELSRLNDGWAALRWPMLCLLIGALVPLLLSLRVPDTGARGRTPWSAGVAVGHLTPLRRVWNEPALRPSVGGKALFWGYASLLNLWQILLAREIAQDQGRVLSTVLSEIMMLASAGVIIGGVSASLLSRKRVELGLVPIGALIMLVGTLTLAVSPIGSPLMYGAIATAGAGAATFLVPLNGYVQDRVAPESRGQLLAGSSVLDCAVGMGAVVLQFGMSAVGMPLWAQCLLTALGLASLTWICFRHLGPSCVRFILRTVFTRLYRIRTVGADHIPTEGGVLLTPNHVSYIDTLILSCACERPVRFLMVRDCFATPGVGLFARMFDTIPISRERAKEAISKAAEALAEGTVVCIFPEGQLTRTGALCELKRGFQMIARKGNAPVVPVYMDGLWGTQTSFEREKMFWKRPRRLPRGVRVHFSAPLIGRDQITPQRLGTEMHALHHAALLARDELRTEHWIRRQLGKHQALPAEETAALLQLPWSALRPLLHNAMQLRELGVFRDGQRIGVTDNVEGRPVVILLILLLRGTLHRIPQRPDLSLISACNLIVIDPELGAQKPQIRNCTIIEVNGALLPPDQIDAQFFPAQVRDGFFRACSMPHPTKVNPSDQLQPGWKPSSYGRILPGSTPLPPQIDADFFLPAPTEIPARKKK